MVPGLLIGILIGIFLVAQQKPPAPPSNAGLADQIDSLTPDEIQTLIVKALSKLAEQQCVNGDSGAKGNEGFRDRPAYSWQDVQLGVKNTRRLLPLAKEWMLDALHSAADDRELKPADWSRIDSLINGVRKIIRGRGLRGVAAVRDDRLSEIMIDPYYAPFLTSDDEAIFVLTHELMHVAARSGKLDGFIKRLADDARRKAGVEPTEEQQEDLACDYVASLVLKRFIALNPNTESVSVRVSRVFGYESPAERFARAWEDFSASYNGDPGDEDHLTQYQLIRALSALDADLGCLMPSPAGSVSPKAANPGE